MLNQSMQILKSLSEGMGTAGGVAWTTFGLVFGSFGLTVGNSALTISLGVISACLFLLVAIPVTYWSYCNSHKENDELRHAIEEHENQIVYYLTEYLLATKQECLLKNPQKYRNDYDKSVRVEELKNRLFKNISKPPVSTSAALFLHRLYGDNQNNSILGKLMDTNTMDKSVLKKELLAVYRDSVIFQFEELPLFAKLKTGFIAFCAGFGSLAGCSSGSLGLLTALGIFPGFAAVPLVGWTIIGIACVFGLLLSGMSINTSIHRSKEKQLFVQSETIHHDLKNLAMLKTLSVETKLKAQTKYQMRSKEGLTDNLTMTRALKRSFSFDSYFYRNHSLWNISNNSPEVSNCGFESACSTFSL
ncbi:Uncharacterised protein [Legionella pneumophila subsp. pascullei]|uniref:Uncharacterized protein n=2 Tax=Legionella pneumophila TaxID=446 RepID=A0AAX2IW23_LEGPN|nr:Uncharacterised protein [Legionella pneumophila subsp. pascullei]VEH07276.1 Uncharacterised protein [Legionella pneumophila subsp. pascullei]